MRYLKNGEREGDPHPSRRPARRRPHRSGGRVVAATDSAPLHRRRPRRRHRGARDGAQWPGRARVRTDGARRVHHGSHAGRQLENRPHGRALLGRRHRRTRGRRPVFVKAGTGGRHDSTTASLEPHFGMNSRCRVTGSRTVEPQSTPQHAGAWSLQGVTGVSSFFWRDRVSDRAPLVSRGVRHVRQILNPLRDIRHALHRRDVHAERPRRPEKVRTARPSPCCPFGSAPTRPCSG